MSMFLAAAASGSSQAPLVPGWLGDLIAAQAPGANSAIGAVLSMGIEFNALTASAIKGIRAHWGTGFAPQTVRCSLWYASGPNAGTLISQEDVAGVVGGTIFQTSGAFAPHVMAIGQQYAATISVNALIENTRASFYPSFPSTYADYSVAQGSQSYRFGYGYGVYPNSGFGFLGAYVEPTF